MLINQSPAPTITCLECVAEPQMWAWTRLGAVALLEHLVLNHDQSYTQAATHMAHMVKAHGEPWRAYFTPDDASPAQQPPKGGGSR